MLSKSVGFVFVVVLLAIYGYTNGITKKDSEPKENGNVVMATATNTKQLQKSPQVFKDSFLVYQQDFNELVTLLEDEFENMLLEADKTSFENLVLSKTTRSLLDNLDITYVMVHTVLNEKNKATIITLGDSWGNITNRELIYSKVDLKDAEPIASNWYQIQTL
jgi:hypothetical protein